MTNSSNIQDNEKVSIILNLLDRDELHFMQTLNEEEQQSYILT